MSVSVSPSPSLPSRRARAPQRGVGRPPGLAAEGTRAGGRWLAATWPPKGVALLRPPTPLPPTLPCSRGAEVRVALTCPRRGGGRGAGRKRAWLGASPLFHSHGREQAGSSCRLLAAPTPALSMETREPCDFGRKPRPSQRQWQLHGREHLPPRGDRHRCRHRHRHHGHHRHHRHRGPRGFHTRRPISIPGVHKPHREPERDPTSPG